MKLYTVISIDVLSKVIHAEPLVKKSFALLCGILSIKGSKTKKGTQIEHQIKNHRAIAPCYFSHFYYLFLFDVSTSVQFKTCL